MFRIILLELRCARQPQEITRRRAKSSWRCWITAWTRYGHPPPSIGCSCDVMSILISPPKAGIWIPSLDGLLISSSWSPMFLPGSLCGLSQNCFDDYSLLISSLRQATPAGYMSIQAKGRTRNSFLLGLTQTCTFPPTFLTLCVNYFDDHNWPRWAKDQRAGFQAVTKPSNVGVVNASTSWRRGQVLTNHFSIVRGWLEFDLDRSVFFLLKFLLGFEFSDVIRYCKVKVRILRFLILLVFNYFCFRKSGGFRICKLE